MYSKTFFYILLLIKWKTEIATALFVKNCIFVPSIYIKLFIFDSGED